MRVNRGPLLPSESRPSQPTGTVVFTEMDKCAATKIDRSPRRKLKCRAIYGNYHTRCWPGKDYEKRVAQLRKVLQSGGFGFEGGDGFGEAGDGESIPDAARGADPAGRAPLSGQLARGAHAACGAGAVR